VPAGDPKFPGTQQIPDFPAARFAELLGLRGLRIDRSCASSCRADSWAG